MGSEMCIRDRFFIPDYAQATSTMRQLLAKDKVFFWDACHQFEFEHLKTILSKKLLTHHYNPHKPLSLLTDASRHHGLGFALCQFDENNNPLIVTCGSKSLTPTQKRYAIIELECLAIIWAIQKCSFYLKGLPTFSVLTDHRPLEGIFKKGIEEMVNPRLQLSLIHI